MKNLIIISMFMVTACTDDTGGSDKNSTSNNRTNSHATMSNNSTTSGSTASNNSNSTNGKIEIMHGGKSDNSGDGGYYPWDDADSIRGLKFNALQDFKLLSVKVYNEQGQAALRTFTLLDTSNKEIAKVELRVPEGESRLQFDFPVTKGNNYKLLADLHKGLFRNSSATYPFNIGDAVEITGPNEGKNAYYFFYDWEIETRVITGHSPVLTLTGEVNIRLNVGAIYNESGATASDPEDGDLTSQIKISGSVDTNTIGTYTLHYFVKDSDNNVANATRTIHVRDPNQSKSLSDYDFIGNGYGVLTEPSEPAPGVYKPYVPDLSNIKKEDVLYVSPNGNGDGSNEANPGSLSDLLENGDQITGKTIIALDGTYVISSSLHPQNIDHVNLIAKNKHKAILEGTGSPVFEFPNANINVQYFSIIGFESYQKGRGYFIFGAGNATSYHVDHVYISDMDLHNFVVTIYGGLHSHEWTVDKTIHHHSLASYMWYMMGWHHAVINTLLYNNDDLSLAIRGSYPPNESYDYYNHGNNVPISNRTKHFLADNDWTHMIVNNTFGSNKYDVRGRGSSKAHMGIFFELIDSEDDHEGEAVYFPPKNILIANNAFFDTGVHDKFPLMIWASRGVNSGAPASIEGITIKNNYTDHQTFFVDEGAGNAQAAITLGNTNKTSVPEASFGFSNDGARDYSISSNNSILIDKGDASIWNPNSSNGENARDSKVDIGAFEYVK